jgi:hypothetical protein
MKLRPRKPKPNPKPKPEPVPEPEESSTSESESSESESEESESSEEEQDDEGFKYGEAYLSAYERSRLKPVACLAGAGALPPRTCAMTVAGLRKLSDFFQLAVISDTEKDEAAKRKKLQKQADAAWAKIEPRYLEAASSGDESFACKVAAEILPTDLRIRFEPLETLSQGKSGITLRVYSLERNRNEILKVSQEDTYLYKNREASEYALQSQAAALGLAPSVYDLSVVVLDQKPTKERVVLSAFSMEEMRVTFRKYFEECADEATRKKLLGLLNQFLRRLKSAKVTHGDLHLDNIMLRFKPGTAEPEPELLAIDWARAAVGVYFPEIDQLDTLLSVLYLKEPKETPAKLKARAELVFRGLGLLPVLRKHISDWEWLEEYEEETRTDRRRAYRKVALRLAARALKRPSK